MPLQTSPGIYSRSFARRSGVCPRGVAASPLPCVLEGLGARVRRLARWMVGQRRGEGLGSGVEVEVGSMVSGVGVDWRMGARVASSVTKRISPPRVNTSDRVITRGGGVA